MLDALQLQLLTTLAATSTGQPAATPATATDFTTQDMWQLLVTLLDETLARTSAAPGPALLEWQFDTDSLDSRSYQVDVAAAGTYGLVSQANCASVSVLVNDRPVALPFRAKAGEQVTVIIERAAPGEAAVRLLSIVTYRLLVAAASQPGD